MPDIEEHIRRAEEEGQFKDLPGKGKPLHIEDNPFAAPEWRLAHHLLHSSGFSLPWIEVLNEIDADIQRARSKLERSWQWYLSSQSEDQTADIADYEWQKAQDTFLEEIKQINKRIEGYNLGVPSERFQRSKLNPEHEINTLTSDQT